MVYRISQEKREEIIRLYGDGLATSEIARQTGVSCPTVRGMTQVREMINPDTGKLFESQGQYLDYLAGQWLNPETGKLFKSSWELKNYWARQRINPETGQPFKSSSQLRNYQIRHRTNPETGQPFESVIQFMDYQARNRTDPETGQQFESLKQYMDYLARKRTNPETGLPFESDRQYSAYTRRNNTHEPKNKCLGALIRDRLKELGKNQSWLSLQIDVSRESVSNYVKGECMPKREILEKLFSALQVPYHTLDDVLEIAGDNLAENDDGLDDALDRPDDASTWSHQDLNWFRLNIF